MVFVLISSQVLEEGQGRDFPSIESAKNSLLVRQLFAIPGVQRVFLGPDFVTVTRADDALEWTALKVLTNHLPRSETKFKADASYGGSSQ